MNQKRRTATALRIFDANARGIERGAPPPVGTIDGLAYEYGRKGLDPAPLVRRLVRWHDAGTRIGWTHFVWNWWSGCSKVSEGCRNCYAEGWAKRTGRSIWGRKAARPISKGWRARLRKFKRMSEDAMWRHEFGLEPRERVRIFCGSLMDFAENRDDIQRLAVARAFEIIREADWATFILLTKRPQNIPDLLPKDWGEGYDNVILGTSVESGEASVIDAELQAPALDRVRHLLNVPATVHGVSYEPAIGPPGELKSWLRPAGADPDPDCDSCGGFGERLWHSADCQDDMCALNGDEYSCRGLVEACPCSSEIRQVSWVIYGGESGAKFRPEGTPEDPKLWAREIRDACREHGTAFFHKQSANRFNERGVELDGEVVHEYPNAGRWMTE